MTVNTSRYNLPHIHEKQRKSGALGTIYRGKAMSILNTNSAIERDRVYSSLSSMCMKEPKIIDLISNYTVPVNHDELVEKI